MKGLVDLGTSGTIDGAVAVGMTRNAERECFLFQDVIVKLVVDFSPGQRWVGSSHVAEGSVVHDIQGGQGRGEGSSEELFEDKHSMPPARSEDRPPAVCVDVRELWLVRRDLQG